MRVEQLPGPLEVETAAALEKLAEISAGPFVEVQPIEMQPLRGAAGGDRAAEEALPPTRGRRRVTQVAVWCALSVVVLGGLASWYASDVSQKNFNLFWAPTIDQSRPPIIHVGNNAVFGSRQVFSSGIRRNIPISSLNQADWNLSRRSIRMNI
jgi:hypothetical protein